MGVLCIARCGIALTIARIAGTAGAARIAQAISTFARTIACSALTIAVIALPIAVIVRTIAAIARLVARTSLTITPKQF